MPSSRPASAREPLPQRWGRRVLTIPAVLIFGVIAWSTAWITLPGALVWDLVTGRKDWPTARFLVLALGYPLMEVVGLTYLALTTPLAWVPGWSTWNKRFQIWWGQLAHRFVHWTYSMDLQVEGLAALSPGPVVMLMRHTSQADTLLVPYLVGHGLRRNLRYVLKQDLRQDPCFDILGGRGRHAFVSRGRDPAGDRARLAWLLGDLAQDDVVVIYPEGTRTSPEKKAQLARRLAEKGETALLTYANDLVHLLPPRLGGTLAILDDNPGCDVVICGHIGLEGASRFDLFREGELTRKTVRVRFWRFPWADVPTDPAGRKAWLLDVWKRLDDWVDQATPRD
jgi:1-acyl-sn-glycerol-3-phosphate acyltransferase